MLASLQPMNQIYRARHLMPTIRNSCLCAALILLANACMPGKPRRFETLMIRGTPQFEQQVTNALTLLQRKSAAAYTIVTNEIGMIAQARRSGMKAYVNPPTFEMSASTAFYSLTWCAGSIAHDSFHSKLYHDYLKEHPRTERVPDEIWTGEDAEKRCSEHQIKVLTDIGAPLLEVDWCHQTNRYWEIKYQDRNW